MFPRPSQPKLQIRRQLRNKIAKIYARTDIQTPSRSWFSLFKLDQSLSIFGKSISVQCLNSSLTLFFFRRRKGIKRGKNEVHWFLIPLFYFQIVNFTTPKTLTPTVIVSASHLNPVPQHLNSVATWVEVCKCHNLHDLHKLSINQENLDRKPRWKL